MPDALGELVSRRLLPQVTQPAQYIGREINQIPRDGDWDRADIRIVIAFPDAYAIGMSHLGCQIIYWLANHTEGVCAERCYTPLIDAEAVMRREGIPLFTWDTRQAVSSADVFAFSLQYEMGYSNLLTMLDLAGLPLWTRERDDSHPLVIAGGPQADNPEPVADFLDLVVIGDAESTLPPLLAMHKELKSNGVPRREMIEVFAKRFPWVYAPSLYEPSYLPDGTLAELRPRSADLPTVIQHSRARDLDDAPFPVRPLVPHVQTVHDRMSIEIMRGCPQPCRFCHAGNTKKPVRIRSVDRIIEIAETQFRSTGHAELGLLSLSTADYPHLRELATRINERFSNRMVNISLPSLRVDKMLQSIPWMASSVRKAGLTIAAEAADDTLRRAIRKKVTDGDLMDGITEAYKAGWRRIKCYFMVGLPGETEDDIRAIHELTLAMSFARKRIGKGPASITASIGWLVPKPHTPLQWAAQQRSEYFENARRILTELRQRGRLKAVQIKTHDPARSVLEAVLSRGDRRLAATIERAWRLGARFDAWDEHFRIELWRQAFEETGIDPDWYAHRERAFDEVLPWDHIQSGPKREMLERQYRDVFDTIGQAMPEPGIVPKGV
ncbi:MAG: TIGR03960 family B12-binding radical SAM protein [Planctomycetota bacterium]